MRRGILLLIGLWIFNEVYGAGIQRISAPTKEFQPFTASATWVKDKEKGGKDVKKGKKKVKEKMKEEGDEEGKEEFLDAEAIQWKYKRFNQLFKGYGIGLSVGWIADFLVMYGIFYERAYFLHVLMKAIRVLGYASFFALLYLWVYFLGWHFAYLYKEERDWKMFLRGVIWGLVIPTLAWLLQLGIQIKLWNSIGG